MNLTHQNLVTDIISDKTSVNLKIRDDDGVIIGEMLPLTLKHLNNQKIIQLLTDWRNQNMESFLSQFVATPERTSNWLKNVFFNRSDQLLFLISVDEKYVGHFGFKQLTAKDVLLDNAIRGSREGHPKLYTFAGKTLINWLVQIFSIERIYGQVLADNVPAIMMNKQIGFQGWQKYPLVKVMTETENNWTMGAKNGHSPDAKYCYEVEILVSTLPQPTN